MGRRVHRGTGIRGQGVGVSSQSALRAAHVYAADALGFTRDPFDALIVASAQTLGLPLVTRDALIRESGSVAVVW